MIKQLKMGFKMLRYTFGTKMCIGLMALFMVMGIALSLIHTDRTTPGTYLLLVVGMWPVQLIYSMNVSRQVQTSPWKKAMETSIPTLISFVGLFACYLVAILIKLPQLGNASEEELGYMAAEMIFSGTLLMILMLYCGLAYKFFILSTVIFFVMYLGMTIAYNMIIWTTAIRFSFGAAVVIGMLEIVIGALLQYGVSLLVYRYPLAKRAQLRGLQKYM